ncbi:MAG: AMP-binding protein [Oscillospiraceae bacterium]|nr:AMP-binding protein [Oscillospiraceae bacterium]
METIKDILNYAAEQYGKNPAFRYKRGDEIAEKTYDDLKHDTEAFSAALGARGFLGRHTAIIGATSYEWIVSYFGTVNSGGVVIPIDVLLSPENVCELLDRADAEVFVYDKNHIKTAELAKEICPKIKLYIPTEGDELSVAGMISEDNPAVDVDIDKDKMCAILFTSGTTGKSKGVMLTHFNLTENVTNLDTHIKPNTVSMTVLPIHHAYCFSMDILKSLSLGTTICINDSMMRMVKNMSLFKPQTMLLVPMMLETLYSRLRNIPPEQRGAAAKQVFGGRLETIFSGGAYLDPIYIDRFKEMGIDVFQGYGMTECSPVISTNMEGCQKNQSVGKLMPNCEAKISDGEIWVKGTSVMQGYYKMPKETAETLEDGWLKTGDLGYIDEDGFVYITGRKKNLIILSNGENISPEEIENELSRNDIIKEIIVRGKDGVIEAEIFPDEEFNKGVENIKDTLQGIIDDLNLSYPPYKRIARLIVRDTEFEKTPSKKIKRT